MISEIGHQIGRCRKTEALNTKINTSRLSRSYLPRTRFRLRRGKPLFTPILKQLRGPWRHYRGIVWSATLALLRRL